MPAVGAIEDTARTGVVRAPSARSAARRSSSARRAGGAEVGLGDHEHVGHLHDPGLQELQRVAGAGLDDDGDRVRGLGDVGLGLADADGLDHDDVERVGQRLRGRAGRGREAAEALAGGHRADEDVAVGGVVLDPRAVAEQRAAAALGGRVDREHRHRLRRASATRAAARESSVDLPTPGGPVTPTTCPAPSPAAETSAAASARAVRVSSRLSAAGATLRSPAASRAPRSAPRAPASRRVAPHRGLVTPRRQAAAPTPLRSATSAAISCMIRSSSKSLGV